MRAWRIKRLKRRLIEIEAKLTYRGDKTDGMVPRTWLNEAAELAGKIARLEAK